MFAPEGIYRDLSPYVEELRSIFIVSKAVLAESGNAVDGAESSDIEGLSILVETAEDEKCERCWVHDPSVGDNREHPTVCSRCTGALAQMAGGS